MIRKKGFDLAIVLGIIVAIIEFLLPIALHGQTVTIKLQNGSSGCAFPPGFPLATYDQQYVYCKGNWGVVQLDTVAMRAVELTSLQKCGFTPTSASGWYIKGDCNGISSYLVGRAAVAGQDVVQISNITGNCSAQYRDINCQPPQSSLPFPIYLYFSLGNLNYLGSQATFNSGQSVIPSTQTADPQGRVWSFVPSTPYPYWIWTAQSAGPTNTPTPTVTGTPPTVTSTPTNAPPTLTPTKTATGQATATPTPCQGSPCGTVGPYFACYDCSGNVLSGCMAPPNPKFGMPCIPVTTHTPTPTRTRTPTFGGGGGGTPVTPFTSTPTPSPTPTPQLVCVTTTPVITSKAIVVPFREPR